MGELFAHERISDIEMDRVPMSDSEIERYSLRPGDLLFARQSLVLEGAGKCSIVLETPEITTFESHLIRVRLNQDVADPQFFFNYFKSHHGKASIASIVMQVAAAGIRGSELATLSVPSPPLHIQKHVACILSAYDDLIDNNTHRMKILEKMAQMICREWFVNFRFPGHEKFQMVKSEIGPIPKGWRAGLLRDMCESIDYGYTASAVEKPIGPKLLRITDIVPETIDWPSVPHCPSPERNPQKYRLLEGDIVVARTGATTGYAKRLNKRHPESIFASYLVRLRIKPEHSNSMVGLLVESDDYKRFIKANLGGAAQPQANAQVLASKPVAIPPSELQAKFSAIAEPLLDQKEILQIKNVNLRQTRDLLLPKLISGEVSVEQFEAKAAQGV
jgi:type I restriction enzyme S subunit